MVNKTNLEKGIIEHGAPTLARIKTGSLFTVKITEENIVDEVEKWNRFFVEKGVALRVLRCTERCALVYMYREVSLERDFEDLLTKEILKEYGYEGLALNQAIDRLTERLKNCEEFPHEIGLFLGYPAEDVKGFICNNGFNCNLCGYWKVYGNTKEALIKFERYDKCRAIYKRLWEEGKEISLLTVA